MTNLTQRNFGSGMRKLVPTRKHAAVTITMAPLPVGSDRRIASRTNSACQHRCNA